MDVAAPYVADSSAVASDTALMLALMLRVTRAVTLRSPAPERDAAISRAALELAEAVRLPVPLNAVDAP